MSSIVTNFFGPIFVKDMAELSRHWRTYLYRCLFGTLLLVSLGVVYQDFLRYKHQRPGEVFPLALMAEQFFHTYLWVQYVAVLLLVPLLVSGAVAGEHEKGTLDLLLTTQLRNRDIYFGKLGSRLMSLVMLILSGIPIVAFTMLFGGVDLQVFWNAMLGTLVVLVWVCANTMFCSIVAKDTLTAVVLSFGMLSWVWGIPLIIMLTTSVLLYWQHPDPAGGGMMRTLYYEHAELVISLLSPFAPFVVGISADLGNQFQRLLGNGYLYWMMISPLAWSALVLAASLRVLRHDRTIIKKKVPDSLAVAKRNLLEQVWSGLWFVPVFRFLMRWLGTAPPDRWLGFEITNPLWQRSRRVLVHDRMGIVIIMQLQWWILCVAVIVALFIFQVGSFKPMEYAWMTACLIWTLLFLIAIFFASIGNVLDRQRGLLDQLLVTPITPRELVNGALLTGWQHWYLTFLLLIVVVILFVAMGYYLVWEAILMFVIDFLSLAVFLLEAVACSLEARSVVPGLFSGFAIPVTLWVALPMLGRTWNVNFLAMLLVVGIVLAVSWALMHWGKNSFTIPFYLGSVHLVFVLFASVLMLLRFDGVPFSEWSMIERGRLFTYAIFQEHRHLADESWSDWIHAVGYNCLTQLLFLVWLYRWLNRNVDVMVGRMPTNSPIE